MRASNSCVLLTGTVFTRSATGNFWVILHVSLSSLFLSVGVSCIASVSGNSKFFSVRCGIPLVLCPFLVAIGSIKCPSFCSVFLWGSVVASLMCSTLLMCPFGRSGPVSLAILLRVCGSICFCASVLSSLSFSFRYCHDCRFLLLQHCLDHMPCNECRNEHSGTDYQML